MDGVGQLDIVTEVLMSSGTPQVLGGMLPWLTVC